MSRFVDFDQHRADESAARLLDLTGDIYRRADREAETLARVERKLDKVLALIHILGGESAPYAGE